MTIDLPAATDFVATHARILDRRRFQVLLPDTDTDPAALLAALDGYRNSDGGYGWGLEADLRTPESQPGAALHAFEVFEDLAPATAPQAVALCDWLASVSLPNGGLPFALPIGNLAGCAPWWTQAEAGVSSLQITAAVAANAHRAAAHDPAVLRHPWLADATRFCLGAIEAIGDSPHALELAFAMRFLDAAYESHPEVTALIERLAVHIPADGLLHVEGGTDDETMRPLDFAPFPDRPTRTLFTEDVVEAELARLAGQQQEDGGWPVDYASFSPAATLEWRGYMTVRAVSILRHNASSAGSRVKSS
jgi:hypothetical protein